ncbi:MAG: hypothetical protein ACRCSQ_01585 [Bacteroidales bacterium]
MLRINLLSYGEYKKHMQSKPETLGYKHAEELTSIIVGSDIKQESLKMKIQQKTILFLKKAGNMLLQKNVYSDYLSKISREMMESYTDNIYPLNIPKQLSKNKVTSLSEVCAGFTGMQEQVRITFSLHLLGFSAADIAKRVEITIEEVEELIAEGYRQTNLSGDQKTS